MYRGRGCLSSVLMLFVVIFVAMYAIPRLFPSDDGDAEDDATASAEQAGGEGDDADEDPPRHCWDVARRDAVRDAALRDLDLETATGVAADPRGGLWITTDTAVLHVEDGRVDTAHRLPGSRLATGPGGEVVVSWGSGMAVLWPLGRDPAVTDPQPGDPRDCVTALTVPEGMAVDDVTVTGDGTVLASYSDTDFTGSLLVAVTPDGGVHHLLGSATGVIRDSAGVREEIGGGGLFGVAEELSDADPEAEAEPQLDLQLDEPIGAINSLVALPDDRLAFTTYDEGVLRLLEGGEVRTIEITPADPDRAIRLTGPAPDGRLLAIAWGEGMPFQIQVIDVDTGETDTVADLEEIEEGAVAATAAGDDLVFLAGGRLWRLEGVFGDDQE